MTRRIALRYLSACLGVAAHAQDTYTGLRPQKGDIPYLLEAEKLIPTEALQATASTSKGGQVITVAGPTSGARTPLPEPIFLLQTSRLAADQLSLYRFEVKGDHREVTLGQHGPDDDQSTLRITLRKLGTNLYRIEAAEMLDPGEYALSPHGDNTAFCFTVY